MFVDIVLCREDLVDGSQKCLPRKKEERLNKGKDYESLKQKFACEHNIFRLQHTGSRLEKC